MNSNLLRLYIIILNWNQLNDTIECIDSITNQTYKDLDIVVIDNGSTDNSAFEIRKRYPEIKVIENEKNLGFQGGMNVGIRYALSNNAELILLLNNDIIADPGMIRHLLENFPDDAGIVSPIMYYYSKPSEIWSSGGDINPILIESIKSHKNKKKIDNSTGLIERDFLPSCAWVVRKDVFEKIGYLDEVYFPIYYDDLDFCLRTRRAGYKLYINTSAKLWHKVSASSGGEYNPRERYLMARNSGYYFRKNMKFWQSPFILFHRCGSAILWTGRLLIKRDYIGLKNYWKGLLVGWFGPMPDSH